MVFRFDARYTNLASGKQQASDDNLKQRSHFHPLKSPAMLSIENVQKEDEAIYVCRVDYQFSPSKYSKIYFKIIRKY